MNNRSNFLPAPPPPAQHSPVPSSPRRFMSPKLKSIRQSLRKGLPAIELDIESDDKEANNSGIDIGGGSNHVHIDVSENSINSLAEIALPVRDSSDENMGGSSGGSAQFDFSNASTSNFCEPAPQFKALVSYWKGQDITSDNTRDSGGSKMSIVTHASRRTTRQQAKRQFLQRCNSGDLELDQAKRALRQPKNVYQQKLAIKKDFQPPSFERNFQEKEMIRKALTNNFVFAKLTYRQLATVVSAFEKFSCKAGKVIYSEGEPGDYFYIVLSGAVTFLAKGRPIRKKVGKGACFGELSLIYTFPRTTSVKAVEDSEFFRVDQATFKHIMQSQAMKSAEDNLVTLRKVPFLKDLTEGDLKKLSVAMNLVTFHAGEVLVKKGRTLNSFYVIREGKIQIGDDVTLGAGEYFGEQALVESEIQAEEIVGKTAGSAILIDRQTFEMVLGSMSHLIIKTRDAKMLETFSFIQCANLDSRQMADLADLVKDKKFRDGSTILRQKVRVPPALFVVREGQVRLKTNKSQNEYIVEAGQSFGERMMWDASRKRATAIKAPYSVVADGDCVCAMLTLADCRTIFDTDPLQKPSRSKDQEPQQRQDESQTTAQSDLREDKETKEDLAVLERPKLVLRQSVVISNDTTGGEESDDDQLYVYSEDTISTQAALKDLDRHKILGEGTFGQVWFVSETLSDGSRRPMALKIMSKYEIWSEGQVASAMTEKETMSGMNHPFIIKLLKTYQDDDFLYMLLELVQGGELFSIMHRDEDEMGLPEGQAKFYALCLADALSYIHRKKYVFRDLKPENVMIDSQGYPKLIDFGFAKYLTDKTYTLCGTPGYLPPEVVLSLGHDWSADHWSLGILIYEMITGFNPFYFEGIDQMVLFESIVRDDYDPVDGASEEAADIISKFLEKDPARRLGSLAHGENEIFQHPWFRDMDRPAILQRKVEAPWVPEIDDPFDTKWFDSWDSSTDKTKQTFPEVPRKELDAFVGF